MFFTLCRRISHLSKPFFLTTTSRHHTTPHEALPHSPAFYCRRDTSHHICTFFSSKVNALLKIFRFFQKIPRPPALRKAETPFTYTVVFFAKNSRFFEIFFDFFKKISAPARASESGNALHLYSRFFCEKFPLL